MMRVDIHPLVYAAFSLEEYENSHEMVCDDNISQFFSVEERRSIRSILDDARAKISDVAEIALARIDPDAGGKS